MAVDRQTSQFAVAANLGLLVRLIIAACLVSPASQSVAALDQVSLQLKWKHRNLLPPVSAPQPPAPSSHKAVPLRYLMRAQKTLLARNVAIKCAFPAPNLHPISQASCIAFMSAPNARALRALSLGFSPPLFNDSPGVAVGWVVVD